MSEIASYKSLGGNPIFVNIRLQFVDKFEGKIASRSYRRRMYTLIIKSIEIHVA